MSGLININQRKFGEQPIETVSARELHRFLEVGKDFSTWIKERIQQYGFVEGVDYVVAQTLSSPNPVSSKSRRQRVIEYHLSLDMAKELAMVERNEKGKQARQYFIECERQAKELQVADSTADRLLVRKDSKSSNRNMNGMLEMTREDMGKSCAAHHYSNEALMINEIVFGVRKAVDRDSLSATDLNRLIKMEMRNTLLIAKEKSYAERKELLKEYHEQLLLTPPPKPKLLKEKRV
jgi:phage anti-repressor protein